MIKQVLILILITVGNIFTQSIPVFLIKNSNGSPVIEKIDLRENEMQVYPRSKNSENISLVLPVSEGISGDFVKADDSNIMIARNKSGILSILVQKQDGTQKTILEKSFNELADYDIKVNITGYSVKKVFNITGYNTVIEDINSPVIDMFGGKIPLNEGDFSITTEIKKTQINNLLNGDFEIEYFAGYYFTKIDVGSTKKADVIIDLGAVSSFLTKDALPEGTNLYKVYAAETSVEGKKMVEFPLNGFGGKIQNLLSCDVSGIKIGSIYLKSHSFTVIDSFKNINGKKIQGVIGLDILGTCSSLSILIPNENRSGKVIVNSVINDKSEGIDFNISHGHIFIEGGLSGKKIDFLLDTGSPFNFLPVDAAAGQSISLTDGITVFGADGIPVKTKKAVINEIIIGNKVYKNILFSFTENSILSNYGLSSSGGIIGTEFLKNFDRLFIDFQRKILIFQ